MRSWTRLSDDWRRWVVWWCAAGALFAAGLAINREIWGLAIVLLLLAPIE